MLPEAADAVRREKKRNRLPQRVCLLCGHGDLRALQATQVTLCAECRLVVEGHEPVELHHIAGRAVSDRTVLLPANLHAVLSHHQQDWRLDLPKTAEGAEIRALMAWLAATIDGMSELLSRLRRLEECSG